MTKSVLDHPDIIEYLSETANMLVAVKFGDDGYLRYGRGTTYTEEQQDYFNKKYDDVAGELKNIIEYNLLNESRKNNSSLPLEEM